MRFLIRVAFWLSIVLVLLPTGGSKQASQMAAQGNEITAVGAASAAAATVSDMSQFCARQPDACAVGAQAAGAFGQRVQAGAKMLYEFLNEKIAAQATGSVATDGSAKTTATSHASKPAQNTLTPADLAPAWRGPQPRKDDQNKRTA